MKDQPFYLLGKGKKIIDEEDVECFGLNNPEFMSVVKEYSFEDRVLDFDVITSFVYWIIGQQISVHAAKSITNRFLQLVNPLNAENVLNYTIDEFRDVGLSRSKAMYIQNIAKFLIENKDNPKIKDSDRFTSNELRDFFMQIKGVGPWTVNMHLIFILGKKDVFAVKDLAVRKGIKILYNLKEVPNEKECYQLCNWGEYATVGTILAWRVLGE